MTRCTTKVTSDIVLPYLDASRLRWLEKLLEEARSRAVLFIIIFGFDVN